MKKLLLFIIILVCFITNYYQTFAKTECGLIKIESLNSKNLLTYLQENDLSNKINKVCSEFLCETINPSNTQRDIKKFIDSNIKILHNQSEESALEAELKGFRIESISIYCD